ncbi:MAG: 16S rRNA processing protein RimM [Dehalococcoidia bacterium]|nr:16S rRNA processing protein RimM [Dehalococcoidia bacterium]
MSEDRLIVGRVISAWGLRGDVTIEVISTNPRRFLPGNVVFTAGRPLTLDRVRQASGKMVVAFAEVRTRDDAEALQGALLDIPSEGVPPLDEGVYYQHQILGLGVKTAEGRDLGAVTEILTTGANDVYVAHDGKREYLIPAIGSVVQSIDLQRGVITIDPLPGLLD